MRACVLGGVVVILICQPTGQRGLGSDSPHSSDSPYMVLVQREGLSLDEALFSPLHLQVALTHTEWLGSCYTHSVGSSHMALIHKEGLQDNLLYGQNYCLLRPYIHIINIKRPYIFRE